MKHGEGTGKPGVPTHSVWGNRWSRNNRPTKFNTSRAVIWPRHDLMGGPAPHFLTFKDVKYVSWALLWHLRICCGDARQFSRSLVFLPILFERRDEAGIIDQPSCSISGLRYDQGMIWWADLLLTSWHFRMWNMSHEPFLYCGIWEPIWWCFLTPGLWHWSWPTIVTTVCKLNYSINIHEVRGGAWKHRKAWYSHPYCLREQMKQE